MDNSGNNIKLEIEMTNKERGDSIIKDDIEAALEIEIQKNKTIEEIKVIDEIKDINECGKYGWVIQIVLGILGYTFLLGIICLIGYGLIIFFQSLINY